MEKVCQSIVRKYGKFGDMNEKTAYRLLFIVCMKKRIAVDDIHLVNNAVNRILQLVHNLAPSYVLDVGTLKKAMKDLPDAMPVVIDYLKDMKWNHTEAFWESMEVKESEIPNLDASQKEHLIEKDGKFYIETFTPVVDAFHARESRDKKGRRFFYIHAHY